MCRCEYTCVSVWVRGVYVYARMSPKYVRVFTVESVVCTYMYVCVCVCTCEYTCVYMSVRVYTCVYVCVRMCLQIIRAISCDT